MRSLKLFSFILLILSSGQSILAQHSELKTLIIQGPAEVKLSCIVPAVKNGPFINRACRPRLGCTVSSVLPALVNHTKTQNCPEQAAKLLAQQLWRYHKESLPLTIFNGWQWEYYYSLGQFEKESYDLEQRGGSWETAMQANLKHTDADMAVYWIMANDKSVIEIEQVGKSEIEILSFSNLRTRYGYPKNRKL